MYNLNIFVHQPKQHVIMTEPTVLVQVLCKVQLNSKQNFFCLVALLWYGDGAGNTVPPIYLRT